MEDKIFVTRSSMPDFDEYIDEIKPMWETHWLTNMGQKHNELQNKLEEYLSVPNLSLFSNGHMALELTLQALNIEGEVITTPFTFASTTHAIVRNRLTPVFCDINEDNYTIDVNRIEELITDKTSAILPVHVYGNVCDVEAIDKIAKKYNLKVIYDAAHAFGEKYKGNSVAGFGDASMLSFHATKVFNTIEGGAVCYNDTQIGEKLYRLKNFGIMSEEVVDGVGANAKMNEFQAAMGICNLRHIDDEIKKRKVVFEKYIECFYGIKGIKINSIDNDVISNYSYFPIIVDEKEFGKTRNEIYNRLMEKGIYSRKYFYPLTSSLDCFHRKYSTDNTPVALHISKRVLTLPLYADLQLDKVEQIVDLIKDMANE